MKLYLKREKSNINAIAEYNQKTGQFIVLKGSTVSQSIAHSEKFRGMRSIEKTRVGSVVDCKVIKDVVFKSASTAANYVTGTSTNGLITWKDKNGNTLKILLSESKD